MNTNFSDFDLPLALMKGLEKLGFGAPTPVQRLVIPIATTGSDLLVTAATGSGKTLAYLLPMMRHFLAEPAPCSGIRSLVLVPTRELAYQIREHFLQVASFTRLTAGVIVGGVSAGQQVAVLRRNPDFLIATPGRLLDHLERGATDLGDLEFLVLDEADRMLDMGFAPDVMRIIECCNPDRQSLLFSATLTRTGIQSFIDAALRDPQRVQVDHHRAAHPDIRHQRLLADDLEHKRSLLEALLISNPAERVLIFTNTRELSVALGRFLVGKDQRAASLHGELDQSERNRVLSLLREGRIRVLVATDLAARGLDVPGMDLVINFEVPRSGSDYLHRTGRTGRAGASGLAISLVSHPEWNRMESIERYLQLELEAVKIAGLEGRYRGPTHSKAPRKKPESSQPREAIDKTPKVKERQRDRKDIGKRRQPSSSAFPSGKGQEAGIGPLKRPKAS